VIVPEWGRKAAWFAYDIARSSYALMVASVAFPVYFVSVIADDPGGAQVEWALVLALSFIVSGLLSPYVGALADETGQRRSLLAAATLLCCGATAALATVGAGDYWIAIGLFIVAQAAYGVATGLYDSMLSSLGRRSLAFTSSVGWGLGYIGGLAVLLLCLPFIREPLSSATAPTFASVFAITAAFYFTVGGLALLWMPREAGQRRPSALPLKESGRRVVDTVSGWRRGGPLVRFLIAYYLICDGALSVAVLVPVYLKVAFGLSAGEVLMLTLVFNSVAIPATMAFGWWGDRVGERRALYVALSIFVALIAVLVFMRAPAVIVVIPVLLGLVLGSTQALCRSLYARLVPEGRTGELFGFSALVGRLSAALGPLTYAGVAMATGDERYAPLVLIPFFLAGGYVLSTVPLNDAAAAASSRT
jgi:UMF1 family MFS transporter